MSLIGLSHPLSFECNDTFENRTSKYDTSEYYLIMAARRGTRSRCRRPTHIRRGWFDLAHSRAERWDGRRLAPRCRTRRLASDTTTVGAASGHRGGTLPVGEELYQPVVDGWSTVAVCRCRDHQASTDGRRRPGPTPRHGQLANMLVDETPSKQPSGEAHRLQQQVLPQVPLGSTDSGCQPLRRTDSPD